MPTNKIPRSNALKYLHERYVGDDPQRLASLEEERTNLDVAQQIHDLRTAAGLTMRELARRVGTSASAIARLENADYEGHSLAVLRRVAAALNQRVEIRFVPEELVAADQR
jgi:predicted transcriptional regulator